MLLATAVSLDASNNLVIEDESALTVVNDNLTIEAVGSNYVISDPDNELSSSIPGHSPTGGNHTLTVPKTLVDDKGEIKVLTSDGEDKVTLIGIFQDSVQVTGTQTVLGKGNITLDGQAAMGGKDLTVTAHDIKVEGTAILSTRDVPSAGADSSGDSGNLNLIGHEIIVGSGAKLLADVKGAGAHTAGNVTLEASDTDLTGVGWFDDFFREVFANVFGKLQGGSANVASITISGAEIKGNDVSIKTTAKYDSSSILGTEIWDGFNFRDVLSVALKLGSEHLFGTNIFALPFGVLVRFADAKLKIDGSSTIDASGNVNIETTASANGTTEVLHKDFSVAFGMAHANADTKIDGSTIIRAKGNVLLRSDSVTNAAVAARTSAYADKAKNTLSLAISKTDLVSHVTINKDAVIHADGSVNVFSTGNNTSTGNAEYSIWDKGDESGTGGFTIAVSHGESDVKASVDGTLISDTDVKSTFISSAENTFDKTNVSNADDTIEIADHGYSTGDRVVYATDTSTFAGKDVIKGLSDGAEYIVFVVDKDKIKLTSAQGIDISNSSVVTGAMHSFSLVDLLEFNPAGKVNPTNNTIDVGTNSFAIGDRVFYISPLDGVQIGGLTTGTQYEIGNVTGNKIQLKDGGPDGNLDTPGDNVTVPLTDAGDGAKHVFRLLAGTKTFAADRISDAVDSDTNIFKIMDHGYSTGDTVQYDVPSTTTNIDVTENYSIDPEKTYTGADAESNLVDYANDRIVISGANSTDPDSSITEPLPNGTRVKYLAGKDLAGIDNESIGGLTDGNTYVVLNADTRFIQLAEIATPSVAINLVQPAVASDEPHLFVATFNKSITNPSIVGLTGGESYVVSTIDSNHFRLTKDAHEAAAAKPIDLNKDGTSLASKHSLSTGLTDGVGIKAELTSEDGTSAVSGTGGEPGQTDFLGKKELQKAELIKAIKKMVGPAQKGTDDAAGAPCSTASSGGSSSSSLQYAGSVAFSYSDHDVKVEVGPTAVIKSKNDVDIFARHDAKYQQAAEASVDGSNEEGTVLSASVSVGIYNNDVNAVINGGKIDAASDLRVDAKLLYPILGSATHKPGETAVFPDGVNTFGDAMKPSNLSTLLDGKLGIVGTKFNNFTNTTGSGGTTAVAGAVAYVGFDTDVRATIDGGAKINQGSNADYGSTVLNNADYVSPEQSVDVNALSQFDFIMTTGIFGFDLSYDSVKGAMKKGELSGIANPVGAEGSKGGVGASVFVMSAEHDTIAMIGDSTIKVGNLGYLDVDAKTTTYQFNFTQAGASASKFALAGTFAYTEKDIATLAEIRAATITGGTVSVDAYDQTTALLLNGGITTSESIGLGVTIGINEIDRETKASITNGANINADGDVLVNALSVGNIKVFSLAGSLTKSGKKVGDTPDSAPSAPDPADGNCQASPTNTDGSAATAPQPSSASGSAGAGNESAASKTGIAGAGDVSVNRSDDKVEAYISNSNVSAQSIALSAVNETDFIAAGGAAAVSLKKQDNGAQFGFAGSFGWNELDGTTKAYVDSSTLHQRGDYDQSFASGNVDNTNKRIDLGAPHGLDTGTAVVYETDDKTIGSLTPGRVYYVIPVPLAPNKIQLAKSLDDAKAGTALPITDPGAGSHKLSQTLSLNADRAGDLFALSAGVGVVPAKKGFAIAGSVSVNQIDNLTETSMTGGTATLAGDTALRAKDTTEMLVIAGSVAYGGKAGIGASVAVNFIENETKSLVTNSSTLNHSGDLDLEANNDSSMIVAAGAIGVSGDKLGVSGTVAVNKITNTTIAGIVSSDSSASVSPEAVTVKATDNSVIKSIAASIGAAKTAGLGAGVAYNEIGNTTEAYVRSSQLNGASLSVAADSTSTIRTIAAGGAGGQKLAVAAGVSVNEIANTIDAKVSDSQVSTTGSVSVTAKDDTTIWALAGNVAGAGKVALGASIGYNNVDTDVKAHIDGATTTVNSTGGHVQVLADSTTEIRAISAGGQGAGKVAIGGSVSINEYGNDVSAYVGDGTSVAADGSVSIQAVDAADFLLIGGVINGAGTAAVGVANTTLVTDNDVAAYVGKGATVQANGNQTVVDVHVGTNATDSMRGVAVTATSNEKIYSFAVAGSGAGKAGIAGSAVVNVLDETTTAYIDESATVNAANGSAHGAQDVVVLAHDETEFLDVAGGLAGGGTAGVGAGADVTTVTKTTEAKVWA
ncbi:MAG: hypothetical protein MK179_19550, partial [Pirellulaceae bacterium]|nr:hypothetical protein [Pirellulaceae bacterium]